MHPPPLAEGRAKWPATWDTPRARLAALVAALVLWTIACFQRSLWEDEFHSLYHAQAESVPALLARVRGDNHPPLSFLAQHASRAVFGETPFALRLPSLLAGLALLLVHLRLSTRLAHPAARGIAPWLAVASSYLLCMIASARMYPWLALATLGLVERAVSVCEGKRGRLGIAAWIAVGLHSHYAFFHHLALLGLTGFALWLFAPTRRRALERCLLPGMLGLAAFLPWGWWAFVHQLGTGDQPSSTYRGFLQWFESYAHFLFLNAREGGPLVHYGLALPGVFVGALLGVHGALRLARQVRADASVFAALMLALGILGPAWTYGASLLHARSGFNLRYLASFAAPALLIVAAGVPGAAWRRGLACFLLAAMLVVALVNALTPGRQDLRGAVEHILAHAQPGDAVMLRSWWFRDPEHSPTDYGWYADRLAGRREQPVAIPVERAQEALAYPRVWVIHASGYRLWVLKLLSERFRKLESFPCGPDATVQLYFDPRDG